MRIAVDIRMNQAMTALGFQLIQAVVQALGMHHAVPRVEAVAGSIEGG
jgi:hypothetical protein